MSNITFQFGEGAVEPSLRSIDGAGELTLIPGVKKTVANITTPDADNKVYNPFPEGLEEGKIPGVARESWKQVQAHLSPEKQSKISYYEKNGEWYINLDGTKIYLQNETATHSPNAGVNVENGNAYFSQPAAQNHAKSKGQERPTNALWEKMAEFCGGFKQLKDILQIPLVGWFHPDAGLQDLDHFAYVWSAVGGEYIGVSIDRGYVTHSAELLDGLSIRLLDI